nr:nucleoside 2-deoxyribosyltransferase [uncultured Methylophaga sp.]
MANLLLVGEIIIDYSLSNSACEEDKLRLGGIVHAARGLWAVDIPYDVAVFCPAYLVDAAKKYLIHHGCINFILLGEIYGAPNLMLIGDVKEVSDQNYKNILRDEKIIKKIDIGNSLKAYSDILVFPGTFSLPEIRLNFSNDAKFSFDIAYDVDDLTLLNDFKGNIEAIITSTSSNIFRRHGHRDLNNLISLISDIQPQVFLLKENRGGSRLFLFKNRELVVEEIPATLTQTVNSIGVGDVYSAVMIGLKGIGWTEAAWRGAICATNYSATTYPDDFRTNVSRDLVSSFIELKALGGTFLPWHERKNFPIYLAAPDFSYVDRTYIEKAIESLDYHNFLLRRPVFENGEIQSENNHAKLLQTYNSDVSIINETKVIFAIPLDNDPGTLVEIGMGIAMGKPVITYDPKSENRNTMVIAGSNIYSDNLDICLNGLFEQISKLRKLT